MTVLKILQAGEPILERKARPAKAFGLALEPTFKNMEETMRANHGVGLAAPQVGVGLRICVVKRGEGVLRLVNPIIMKSSGREVDWESCLSYPGWAGQVPRFTKIKVRAKSPAGRTIELVEEGLTARIIQHEMDHLDGIMFTKRVIGALVNLDELDKDEISEPGTAPLG